MKRFLPWLIPLGLALFFAPQLFGGKVAQTASMARYRPFAEVMSDAERSRPSHNPDCVTSYYPRRQFLHDAFANGHLPYWNPYTFAGSPFLADPQTQSLYPPNVALAGLDPRSHLGWFLFLHAAWGGLGMFVLLRARGVRAEVAVAAGLAFALNGWFAKHFGQPPFFAVAAWAPWIIALALEVSRCPNPRRAAALGLAGALTVLAGQPQIALQIAYAAAGVALVDWLGKGRAARAETPFRAFAAAGILAGAIALLLASPQLIPTLELASHSARARLPYETIVSGAFHPLDAIRFVVPEFFGSPLTRDEWATLFPRGDGFYLRTQINSVFAGGPVLLLALLGMTWSRTRVAALPFTVLFVVAVLVAFASPLARVAYWLPGFSFSRIDRLGNLIVLAQIVPAALAAHHLGELRVGPRVAWGVVATILAICCGVFVFTAGGDLPERLGVHPSRLAGGLPPEFLERVHVRTLVGLGVLALGALALCLPWAAARRLVPWGLAIAHLFVFASAYRGDRDPADVFPADPPGVAELRRELSSERPGGVGGGRFVRFGRDLPATYALSSVLPPTTNAPYHLRDLQGYNALSDRRLGDALELATGENLFSHGIWAGRRIVAPERAASLEHPIFDALAVRAAVGARPVRADGWTPRTQPGFATSRNDDAAARIRLVPVGRGISEDEWRQRLESGNFRPASEVLWVGEGAHGATPTPRARYDVELLEESPNRIRVRTDASAPAVLVVADSFAKGWTARVDGDPTEILPAWGLVRAVCLSDGTHEIEFEYVPPGFRPALALALIGLLVAGAALFRRG